jgi:hypothetical protein
VQAARRHASQDDSLTQHTIPDPELQASQRCHLSKDAKRVLNAKGESGHVQVAVTSVDIDKQIEVAVRGCFPTRHGSEHPDVAHAKPPAKLNYFVALSANFIQRDSSTWGLNLHRPTSAVVSSSHKPLQFFDRHAHVGENPAKRPFADVVAGMYRHSSAATVGMAHDVMASPGSRDLEASSF